jgi:hypothetical protein
MSFSVIDSIYAPELQILIDYPVDRNLKFNISICVLYLRWLFVSHASEIFHSYLDAAAVD